MDSAHSCSVTSNNLFEPRASISLVVLWGQYIFPLRGCEAPGDSVFQAVMVGSARPEETLSSWYCEEQALCVWALRQEPSCPHFLCPLLLPSAHTSHTNLWAVVLDASPPPPKAPSWLGSLS